MNPEQEFAPFPKIARLSRDIVITEKLDGTNAQVCIKPLDEILFPDNENPNAITDVAGFRIYAGSRNKYVTIGDDNYGFARWVGENSFELLKLGPGQHFGEWWGKGIQRNYSLTEKRFSLFNTHRWNDDAVRPLCCHVVPVLYAGPTEEHGVLKGVKAAMNRLQTEGSVAAPGFMKPEGIVIYHTASGQLFKKTLERDEAPKGMAA